MAHTIEDDRLLIEAAQADSARFVEIYERYVDRIYGFVSRRTRDRATAEDITSLVFEQALRTMHRFEWRGALLSAWLFRIASNALADHWRERARDTHEASPDVPDSHELEDLDRRIALYQQVEQLPDLQRKVIHLRFIEEKSIRQVAAALDRSEGAVKQLAADLRHCPSPDFKARLGTRLQRRTTMATVLTETGIREGFTTITPYIRVHEAGLADFLVQVFDAHETFSGRGGGGGMHREVRVGDSMVMIGEGVAGAGGLMPIRPMEFHVFVKDADTTFRRAIAAGGTSLGEPADRPYGERSGFVRDPFGNHWYIATPLGPESVASALRTVTPFLHAHEAAEYDEFLQRALGATEEMRHDEGGTLRYARLRIGDGVVELGEGEPKPGSFLVYVSDPDGRYQQALAAGATSLMPPTEQPYGRMAGVQDSRGNQWFFSRPATAGR